MKDKIFINRRNKNTERREEEDPCKELDIDIYHRKRRKSTERRENRTLNEDYYAFLSANTFENDEPNERPVH